MIRLREVKIKDVERTERTENAGIAVITEKLTRITIEAELHLDPAKPLYIGQDILPEAIDD